MNKKQQFLWKGKGQTQSIHTWCTRQGYQIWACERTSVPYRTERATL